MGIYNECCCLMCGDCKYHQVDAERREDTTCKRLDHKRIKLAVPWFKSYDCGQFSHVAICADFSPKESHVWLYNHWTCIEDYIADFEKEEKRPFFGKPHEGRAYIGFCIDGNKDVRYYVNRKDYFNNDFLDENGNLKWVKKCYYKKSRKSPIGYRLITEYNKEVQNDAD